MATNVRTAKACDHCRVIFAPPSNRSKFCSRECKIRGLSSVNANGCWVWHGPKMKAGYGTTNDESTPVTAHALSYRTFVGDIPKGMMVCHRCDVRACVNPDHFFLGTAVDNMKDCAIKGRNSRKLTEDQVREIRSATGVSKAELGRRYGVTDAMIGNIIRRKWWKDVGLVE